MPHTLRFGILSLPNVPWPELVARWRYIEDLGFDSVWDCDHYTNPYAPHEPWYEGWTSLAALAVQTTRIRVGMLVACATFRNPVLAAKEALTVDHASGGRLEVGLGAGYPAGEYAMLGLAPPSPAERVARFREAVEITESLFHREETTYTGQYYAAEGAVLRPAPLQQPHPPLTLAGTGPRMLRIIARHADRWNSSSTSEQLPERRAALATACAAIGRDPEEIGISVLCHPSRDPAWENPWTSPDEFRAQVGRYVAAGAAELIFYWPFEAAQVPQMERIAREVLPVLRASGTGQAAERSPAQ